jgi:hypothetical protein
MQAEKMFDIASEFIMATNPQQIGAAIIHSDFARQIEPVALQEDYELFASSSDQSTNATIGSMARQNSFNATFGSEGPNLSIFDIANGFLGFFAMFKNGQHEYLQPYIECYKKLACHHS